MPNSNRAFLLGPLLKGVSRSFYLTLRVLPGGMRDPVGEAYLLARAADTIADTALIPPGQRLALLLSLRERVNGATQDDAGLQRIADEVAGQQTQSDEKLLLESLGGALDVLAQLDETDRTAVRDIVTTLTQGMEFDLRTFPDERSGDIAALATLDELDRYTWLVAGCVGEFWTKMIYLHLPGTLDPAVQETMRRQGVRFGKALQLVNVLRDCGKDLRIGRCYLPAPMLAQAGLTPAVAEDMHRYLAIANYEDRFVIPTGHKEEAEDAYGIRGACGFSFGNGCDAGEPHSSLFGGQMGRRKLTPMRPLDT